MTKADPGQLDRDSALRMARWSVALLVSIHIVNFADRQVLAAVEEPISRDFGVSMAKTGALSTAFLVSYMLASPLLGFLGDRLPRWKLIGVGVLVWTLFSGGSGLAGGYAALLVIRCMVGIGEAAYGPVAPTILADLYPVERRGRVMAWFYAAIPLGSAAGYAVGGLLHEHWRWAFLSTMPPGLLLAGFCFLMPEPRRGQSDRPTQPATRNRLADLRVLLRNPSYILNTAAMTALTFAIGGVGFWMPRYLKLRGEDPQSAGVWFGVILASAGLLATLLGGWAGDRLRGRVRGSYFLVSAGGMFLAAPLLLLMMVIPFPACWAVIFAAVFCLFFNTGPSNTALANVTFASMRATAFAINILIIHALGDALSPWAIGLVADRAGLETGFAAMATIIALGGAIWLAGVGRLEADTARASGG